MDAAGRDRSRRSAVPGTSPPGDHSCVSNSSGSSMPRLTAPPRALPLVLIAGVLPALAFGLAACDSGGIGDGDENSAPNASVTANTTEPVVGDTVALDASSSSDPDGDELSFSWTLETPNGSNASLPEKTAARLSFVPDTSGSYTAAVVVSDGDGSDTDETSVNALKSLPETVTIEFENRATDGDSLIAGTVSWQDSVIAEDVQSATRAIPASRESGDLCFQETNLFNKGCVALTPTSDLSDVQEISADRKTVELTVIPDPPYGDPGQTDVTVYEPFTADSTKFTGENTVDLAKRKDGLTREVTTDLITDDPEKTDHNHDHLDRLVADTSVTAHSNVELTAQPTLVPACSDNMNSIPQDPFEKDENDPGCAQNDGFGYNPDDDNELHSFVQITIGKYYDDSTFVSSTDGERTALITSANSPLPQSVTVAVGEITFIIETKPLGGGFAIHIKSGDDNDNLTVEKTSDVANPDSTNSWGGTEVYGIDRTFFADGPHYAVHAWDSTKANSEPPFDSDKLVIFYEEKQKSRIHLIEYYYEPDHPGINDGSSSGKTASVSQSDFATLDNGECVDISGGTACMNGVPDDF